MQALAIKPAAGNVTGNRFPWKAVAAGGVVLGGLGVLVLVNRRPSPPKLGQLIAADAATQSIYTTAVLI